MLHEVLLALSGHLSPLFDQSATEDFPLISPAESALLANVGRLASLHRALRSHLTRISSYHPSLICRAVATSISKTQLSKFQDLIVDVERQILTKDASSVGAYDIVPLASVVSRFEPWRRRLDWFWELACFMYPADAEPLSNDSPIPSHSVCTGPSVLNRLRSDSQTGYPDIEEAALALQTSAELLWLRHLTAWLMEGVPPRNSTYDFFVRRDDSKANSGMLYSIVDDLIPAFVSREAADSVLFIGRTLGMLVSKSLGSNIVAESLHVSASGLRLTSGNRLPIDTVHLQELATLQSPISLTEISRLVSKLRSSAALKVVDEMLPVHLFMRTLSLLRQFFLVGRVDFTDALIAEADMHISSRHQHAQYVTNAGEPGDLAGVIMKEREVGTVLNKTWSALAPTISKEEAVDEEIELARELVSLVLSELHATAGERKNQSEINRNRAELPPSSRGIFDGLLLSTPTSLVLRLDPAFDLFLSEEERRTYSAIHSYLLAIRRAHNHLSDAWRHATLRRDHPAPIRRGRAKRAFQVLRDQRTKRNARMRALRPVWSSCNAGVVTLAELGAYLAGEVIEQSWTAFRDWALQRHASSDAGADVDTDGTPTHQRAHAHSLPRDPEVLARGHRQFLAALVAALLLRDGAYAEALKSLCVRADALVALLGRLEGVQRSMDLRDEGVMLGAGAAQRSLEDEERDVLGQLADAAAALLGDVARLAVCLRNISSEPPVPAAARGLGSGDAATGFEPYRSRTGVDRLLAKLDFGAGDTLQGSSN